ncbi:MAG: hypothetical protein KF868_13540 [Acidobacteria bacterium]|nr:hypothetical protein [Acidobacteriota bacterium]
MIRRAIVIALLVCLSAVPGVVLFPAAEGAFPAAGLRVGAATVEIEADDSMVIGGGIGPRYVKGGEAPLRATALIIEGGAKVCIISLDLVNAPGEIITPASREIETKLRIPFANIMVSSTHTHSAPATIKVHGITPNEIFRERVREAIVASAIKASKQMAPADLYFGLGQEATVGQNSRLLLSDNTIYWVGPKDDAIRPTGPFDTELPVLAFKGPNGKMQSLIFNHSSHNIGGRSNVRSPAFYGLAAQELEKELGGTSLFLPGAFGSSHVYNLPSVDERIFRIKNSIKESLARADKQSAPLIRSMKSEFAYKVRTFDEEKEDAAVSYYCRKRSQSQSGAERTIAIFRDMRKDLTPRQGEARKTWLQVIMIGDIAFVAIPGEFFTKLGLEIKRRSPFRYTYIVGLANDHLGYLPDREAFKFGGYQTWTGLHSYVAPETGEAMVDEAVRMLNDLNGSRIRR